MALSRNVGRLLRVAVSEDSTPESAALHARRLGADADLLAPASVFHGVTGYVWSRIGDSSALGDDPRRALQSARDWTAANHLRTLVDLSLVRRTLDAGGISWAVVKGPVLAETVHASPDLRGYTDLDVLVRPDELGRALDLLGDAGCVTLVRNWDLMFGQMRGEVAVQLPQGTTLDLHWHLVNDRHIRASLGVSTTPLLDRIRLFTIAGQSVPTLDRVDTVNHLAFHAVLSGNYRLIWIKDIERVLAGEPVCWEEVLERARSWGTTLHLRIALREARRSCGLKSSAGPSSLPASTTWLALDELAARAAPLARADGSGSVRRLVTRATRTRLRDSAAELARHSWTHARERLTRTERASPRTPRSVDPRSPGSAFYESGGGTRRRQFLDAVAREH